MQDHEDRSDDGNADAMPDVGAKERVGVHDGAAQKAKANVVVRRHAQLRAEGTFMTEEGGGACHVRAHSNGPEAELIIWKQVAGEGEQQRQHEKDNANVPIELARFFVRAGEKDPEHVKLDGDDHQVRGPAMHVAQQFAEGHVVFEIENVAEGLHFAGVIVKHEEHAGEGEDDKQIERDAAHAPGVAVTYRVTIDFGGMQMEEDVREHAEGAIARRVVVLVAENRSVNLGFGGLAQNLDLFFGFFR